MKPQFLQILAAEQMLMTKQERKRNMKATGIVRRVDDLGRIVIPKEIRRTLKIREGDPSHTTLTVQEQFCFAMMRFHERVYAKKP